MDTLGFISRYESVLKIKKIPKMRFYKECGISDAAVSQWRKGKTNPAMTTINRIAEYIGVSPEYLLTGEQKNPAPMDGDGKSLEFLMLFNQLSPEDQDRELAYLRERVIVQDK